MRVEHSHLLKVLFVISNVIALTNTPSQNEFLSIFKTTGNIISFSFRKLSINVFNKCCLYYNPLISRFCIFSLRVYYSLYISIESPFSIQVYQHYYKTDKTRILGSFRVEKFVSPIRRTHLMSSTNNLTE